MTTRRGLSILCLSCLALSGCFGPPALVNEELARSAGREAGLERTFLEEPAAPCLEPAPPTPATIHALEAKIRYLSLAEAFALALENGHIGFTSARSPGIADEELVSFNGFGLSGADSLRVLALEPAIVGADTDLSLSRFDAQFFSRAGWGGIDAPPLGFRSTSNGAEANATFGLAKPLSTGGVTGLFWNTDYFMLNRAPSNGSSFFNPTYFTRLQFGFEQPLLLDGGVAINQILDRFPASSLFPTLNGRFGAGQGILVARLRHDQQRAEFERRVNHLLVNVETAYWNLYAVYIEVYSAEQALRMATEVWRIAKELFPEKIDEGDFAGARAQLQSFRGNRLQAIGRVLDAERNLRLLLGLPASDGARLAPVDIPSRVPYAPNWAASVQEALRRRPELTLARHNVEQKRLNLTRQLNRLQPDLRFLSTYTVLGAGSQLDGDSSVVDPSSGGLQTNNALRSLAETRYNDWTVGLQLSMPLGFRGEHAVVRQARLELIQSLVVLKEQETKVHSFLAKQYSRLFELVELLETRGQERRALADQLEVRFKKFAAGKIPIDFLQDSVRHWASALAAEYQAIVDYNNSLASYHFAEGTLLDYSRVHLLEGQTPLHGTVRAVEHERKRTAQLAQQGTGAAVVEQPMGVQGPSLPQLPALEAVALPSLWTAKAAAHASHATIGQPVPSPPGRIGSPVPASAAARPANAPAPQPALSRATLGLPQ